MMICQEKRQVWVVVAYIQHIENAIPSISIELITARDDVYISYADHFRGGRL